MTDVESKIITYHSASAEGEITTSITIEGWVVSAFKVKAKDCSLDEGTVIRVVNEAFDQAREDGDLYPHRQTQLEGGKKN